MPNYTMQERKWILACAVRAAIPCDICILCACGVAPKYLDVVFQGVNRLYPESASYQAFLDALENQFGDVNGHWRLINSMADGDVCAWSCGGTARITFGPGDYLFDEHGATFIDVEYRLYVEIWGTQLRTEFHFKIVAATNVIPELGSLDEVYFWVFDHGSALTNSPYQRPSPQPCIGDEVPNLLPSAEPFVPFWQSHYGGTMTVSAGTPGLCQGTGFPCSEYRCQTCSSYFIRFTLDDGTYQTTVGLCFEHNPAFGCVWYSFRNSQYGGSISTDIDPETNQCVFRIIVYDVLPADSGLELPQGRWVFKRSISALTDCPTAGTLTLIAGESDGPATIDSMTALPAITGYSSWPCRPDVPAHQCFYIGRGRAFIAGGSGTLKVAINDSPPWDNSSAEPGGVQGTVTINGGTPIPFSFDGGIGDITSEEVTIGPVNEGDAIVIEADGSLYMGESFGVPVCPRDVTGADLSGGTCSLGQSHWAGCSDHSQFPWGSLVGEIQ